MAKENRFEVSMESKWDGSFGGRIGTWLLQLLVLAIFVVIGGWIGAGDFIGKDDLWYIDLQNNPQLIVKVVIGAVIILFGFCWAWTIGLKWKSKHTIINGYRLKFKAGALNFFFNVLKWLVLTVITVGLFIFWLPGKYRNWKSCCNCSRSFYRK